MKKCLNWIIKPLIEYLINSQFKIKNTFYNYKFFVGTFFVKNNNIKLLFLFLKKLSLNVTKIINERIKISLNDPCSLLGFCSFSVKCFIKTFIFFYKFVQKSSLSKNWKFAISFFSSLLVFYFILYLFYTKFYPMLIFFLDQLFSFLRKYKSSIHPRKPAYCMQQKTKLNYQKYSTSNSEYGNFYNRAQKGFKKPLKEQERAINNFKSISPVRKLSPEGEFLLFHQHINETNTLESDWKKDKPKTYVKNELILNELKGAFEAPLTYGTSGALGGVIGKVTKNPGTGFVTGVIGYYGYSGVEEGLQARRIELGKQIIEKHGFEVLDFKLNKNPK